MRALTVKMVLELITHEGIVLETYKDSVGVLTWGVGVTNASGHNVDRYIRKPSTLYRALEVSIWLMENSYLPDVIEEFGEDWLRMPENMKAAALSFHWNTGGIKRARWVEKFRAEGATAEVREAWDKGWRQPEGRQQAELRLFFDGRWSHDGYATVYEVNSKMQPYVANKPRVFIEDLVKEIMGVGDAAPPPTKSNDDVIQNEIKAIVADFENHIRNLVRLAQHKE